MSGSLSAFQDDFWRAVLEPVGAAGGAAAGSTGIASLVRQPGFAVYRNTVMKGCIDALQANYPSVLRIVGEEWFRAAAAVYVRAHPPQDSRLLQFGSGLADFLEQRPEAAELPYLAGVARIDRFWTEAHGAQDASPLDPDDIVGLAPETLAATVLMPHPAARWQWFADQPIFTLWCNNRDAAPPLEGLEWKGEGVLVTRPASTVVWTSLDEGGTAFLDACSAGLGLADAGAAALEAQGGTDLSRLMATLLQAGAFSSASLPAVGTSREAAA